MKHRIILTLAILAVSAYSTPDDRAQSPFADSWREVDVTDRPSARTSPSMVQMDGSIYLFGGYDAPVNDLWKFDGRNWERIPDNAPLPTGRHQHVAIAYNNKMYVFDGIGDPEKAGLLFLSDMWAYSSESNRWEEQPQTGDVPPPRANHAMVLVNEYAEGAPVIAWVFGGTGPTGDSDPFPWEFDLATKTWTRKSPNPYGSWNCLSAVSLGGKLYLFGGKSGRNYSNAVLQYDPQTTLWHHAPVYTAPEARINYAVSTQSGDTFLIFGGRGSDGRALNDAWEYNVTTNTWTRRADMPEALSSAAASSLVFTDQDQDPPTTTVRHYVFGGRNGDNVRSDRTYEYIPATQEPAPPPAPERAPRRRPGR